MGVVVHAPRGQDRASRQRSQHPGPHSLRRHTQKTATKPAPERPPCLARGMRCRGPFLPSPRMDLSHVRHLVPLTDSPEELDEEGAGLGLSLGHHLAQVVGGGGRCGGGLCGVVVGAWCAGCKSAYVSEQAIRACVVGGWVACCGIVGTPWIGQGQILPLILCSFIERTLTALTKKASAQARH